MWGAFRQSSRAGLAAWSVPLAVVLFFCVNLVTSLRLDSVRLDLTQDAIYTVSQSTREVLAAVEEPITLRLFRSSALINEAPELRVYADRVTEMLRTYEQLADGRLRVERIDPVPFSAAEDKAIGYNLVAFNLSRGGEQGYFGLVGTNAVDQLEIIDVLPPAREQYLEYELTRMVLRLSSPTEPRIGVIDGLGVFGNMELRRPPSAIIDRLGDDFALLPVEQDTTELPENLDALVIIHPHAMTPAALYAVDQYVLGGGPVLLFLDPLAEHSPPDPANPSRPLYPDSSLDPLLAAWGVAMPPRQIVGDLSMALSIRGQAGNQVATTNYPPWLIVGRDNLRDDDSVTGRLSLMRISSSGALSPIAGAGTSFTPLVQTTAATMLYDQVTLMQRNDPRQLVNMFNSSQTVRTLAARVSGQVSSAFPQGRPAPAGGAADGLGAGNINVIVVADTDMLADSHNVDRDRQPTTQNMDFVVNAIDSLTGGGALFALRARSLSFRPFTLVNQIEAAAQSRYRATEQRLQVDLKDAQDRLAALRVTAADGRVIAVTPEQQQAVGDFNRRIVDIREELRSVQAALRQDVETLTSRLRMVNIVAVPGFIVLAGIVFALWRRLRLSRFLRRRATIVGS